MTFHNTFFTLVAIYIANTESSVCIWLLGGDQQPLPVWKKRKRKKKKSKICWQAELGSIAIVQLSYIKKEDEVKLLVFQCNAAEQIIIIMITLHWKVQFKILHSPHCAVNCFQHICSSGPHTIICNTSSIHHVQHVVCHVVWMDSSAIKLTELKSHLFYWLKP